MSIVWPAFLAAGVMEMLVFAAFGPARYVVAGAEQD